MKFLTRMNDDDAYEAIERFVVPERGNLLTVVSSTAMIELNSSGDAAWAV